MTDLPAPDPAGRTAGADHPAPHVPALPDRSQQPLHVPPPMSAPIGVAQLLDPSRDVDARGLLPTALLRRVTILTWLFWLPLSWITPVAGLVVLAVALATLMTWSGLAVENARRAKPATRYTTATHPAMGAVSWLIPPLYAIWSVGMVLAVSVWADDAPTDSDRHLAAPFLAILLFLIGVVLAYLPFGVLNRTAKWVGADSARVRQWFWATALAAALAVVAILFMGVIEAVDGETAIDEVERTTLVAFYGALLLPWLSWLLLGERAMREIEAATAITYHYRKTIDIEPWSGAGRY